MINLGKQYINFFSDSSYIFKKYWKNNFIKSLEDWPEENNIKIRLVIFTNKIKITDSIFLTGFDIEFTPVIKLKLEDEIYFLLRWKEHLDTIATATTLKTTRDLISHFNKMILN